MNPIIWSEGAFLSQQHFQHWEAWLLEQQNRWVSATVPYANGLMACSFEQESFHYQKAVLSSLIFRKESGEWLVFDASTMPAVGTALEDVDEQTLYIFVPNNQLCSGLSGYQPLGEQAAYQATYVELSDRYDSIRKHEVCLGSLRLRLSTQVAPPHLFDSWPLAKIKRVANTHFELDKDFIPVCLTINGSENLVAQLKRILGLMTEKLKHLQDKMLRSIDSLLIEQYALISEISFDLNEFIRHGCAHPREVYSLLCKFASRLALFNQEFIQPEPYSHQEMGLLFNSVFKQIGRSLQNEFETIQSYVMTKNNRQYYGLENINPEHLQGHEWYLGVDFSHQSQEALPRFISQAKLGTLATLEQMIASALPGIPFAHVTRTPKSVAVTEGYEYFKLNHECVDWKHVKTECSLMLYIPPSLEGKKVTLNIVKD